MLKKFLIINPFGIGDVLFTTPVIRAIKEAYPDSFMAYWCNLRVKDVLKDNPHIDKIWSLSRGDIKKIFKQSKWKGLTTSLDLLQQLRKAEFDICFDFSLDWRYGLLTKLAGIKKRVGFNYKKRGRFLTEKIDIDGYNDKHVVDYYLDLLKIIDIIPKHKNLDLFISEEQRGHAKGVLANLGVTESELLFAIAPGGGASWGKDAYLKHWPQEKFAQLVDRLSDDFIAKILILGDTQEKEIAKEILARIKNKNRVIDLVGKISLEELVAIINYLEILITNDAGPLHIAVALNKKSV
ncbi:MAG: glycosyltransferase family 9 protein, partial [Candidatus Omnitrophica bacterium]|nr:glycosyltransferase family 9 protein [Candidatus Omnitrophota bacterium]